MHDTHDDDLESALNLSLTSEAAAYIQQMLVGESEDKSILGIRFGLESTGCSGFSYIFDFARSIEAGDKKILIEGIPFIMNVKAFPFLRGTTIDCQKKDPFSTTLKFRNPQVKGECGCGESVNIEVET